MRLRIEQMALALRLRRWVMSTVKEVLAEIRLVKLKPHEALLRACICYSPKPGYEQWEGIGGAKTHRLSNRLKKIWLTWFSSVSDTLIKKKTPGKHVKTHILGVSKSHIYQETHTPFRCTVSFLNWCPCRALLQRKRHEFEALLVTAAPKHRTTGVLTTTKTDRLIRRINISKHIQTRLVQSDQFSAWHRCLQWIIDAPNVLKSCSLFKITHMH